MKCQAAIIHLSAKRSRSQFHQPGQHCHNIFPCYNQDWEFDYLQLPALARQKNTKLATLYLFKNFVNRAYDCEDLGGSFCRLYSASISNFINVCIIVFNSIHVHLHACKDSSWNVIQKMRYRYRSETPRQGIIIFAIMADVRYSARGYRRRRMRFFSIFCYRDRYFCLMKTLIKEF